MNDDLQNTTRFVYGKENIKVREVISYVYAALKKKGYDPVSQIVGYILSGDPTYITSYDSARSMIRHIERDEMLEELVRHYLELCDGDKK